MKYENYHSYSTTIMCPKCFGYQYVEFNFRTKLIPNKNDVSGVTNFIAGCDTPYVNIEDISGKCPYCNEEINFIKIDPAIVRTISILNKKGYKTRWCCAGHEDELNMPYIAFETPLPEHALATLPGKWHHEPRGEYGAFDCIRGNRPSKDSYYDPLFHYEELYDIYDWAKNLPDLKNV